MLILKGTLLSVVLFVVVLVVSYYAIVPRNVPSAGPGTGPMQFPLEWLRHAGLFTLGIGLGALLIGAGLLWIHRLADIHLHSALRSMQ
jgi:hypothetical protein